jgi:hypothetical protein
MLCIGTVPIVAAHTLIQALKAVSDTVSIIKPMSYNVFAVKLILFEYLLPQATYNRKSGQHNKHTEIPVPYFMKVLLLVK